MYRCVTRAAWLLLATPICAFAFEAVDVLTPADSGVYPAYPSEPLPPYGLWGQFGLMYDTNILRQTTGDNNETVARLGIGGRYHPPGVRPPRGAPHGGRRRSGFNQDNDPAPR